MIIRIIRVDLQRESTFKESLEKIQKGIIRSQLLLEVLRYIFQKFLGKIRLRRPIHATKRNMKSIYEKCT